MGCGVYWTQVNEATKALNSLRNLGLDESSLAFREINQLRGKLLAQVGIKFPRTPLSLLKLVGLSPGTITVLYDPEFGPISMARVKPGAEPVYKRISYETAAKILKGELTHELEDELMTPTEVFIA